MLELGEDDGTGLIEGLGKGVPDGGVRANLFARVDGVFDGVFIHGG